MPQIELRAGQIAGGISRQPAHERFPGQLADANNLSFSLADGMSKRPGSIFVKKITGLTGGGAYRMHPINRDATEKYIVIHKGGVPRIFHIDGTEATVNAGSATATSYLTSNSPTAEQMRLLSVADYTIIANGTVQLGVTATPSYTLTSQWPNYDQMTSHTPTSIPDSTSVNSAGLNSYHRTAQDSAEEPAGYYQYKVGTTTFPTIQFSRITTNPTQWSGPANAGDRSFTIRFERLQDAITGATYNRVLKKLTSTNAWVDYVHQPGDEYYLSSGTDIPPGWYPIQEKLDNSNLRLATDPTSGAGGVTRTDVAASGIGQSYLVNADAGTGGVLPSMHDVALFLQQKLQAAGATDALIEWTDSGAGQGFFTITAPWRGSGARVTPDNLPSGATNPSGYLGTHNYLNHTGAVRVDGSGSGSRSLPVDQRWVRVAAPGDVDGAIDASKAPIKLVRTTYNIAGSTFTYDVIPWSNRTSGNDSTNPAPDMFRNAARVADLFFIRDRLGILAGEGVALSAASDIFRLYLDDALNLVDSDPIEATISSNRVTIGEFAVPVRDTIVIFTLAGQQFAMATPDALTPSTIAFTPSTSIQTIRNVRPCVIDPALYMAAAAGASSQLREAYFLDGAIATTADDVSAHVRGYLPTAVQTIDSHANSGTVFELETGSNKIRVYRAFWTGTRKVQSAWATWTFDASYRISDICVIDDYLYMLVESASQFVLEKVPIFEPSPSSYAYVPHMDRQITLASGTGTFGAGSTAWTLPLTDNTLNVLVRETGATVAITANINGALAASGNYSAVELTIGRSFTTTGTLSEPYARDADGRAIISRVMYQRQIYVQHVGSGSYAVVSTPDAGSNTVTFSFSPPSGSYTANGQFLANAGGDLSRCTLSIVSTSITPLTIAGFTHAGDLCPRMH